MQNSPNTNPAGELTASPSSRTTCKTARTPTRRAGARLAVLAGRHAKQPEHQPDGRGSPSRARLRVQNSPSPGPNHRTSHDRAPSGRLNQPRAIPGKRGPALGQATGHRGRQQSNGNGALEQATGHRSRQQATGAGNRAMETAHWGRQQATGAGNLPTPIGGSLPHCPYPAPIQLTALGRVAPSTRHRLDQYRGAHDHRRAEHTHHRRAEHTHRRRAEHTHRRADHRHTRVGIRASPECHTARLRAAPLSGGVEGLGDPRQNGPGDHQENADARPAQLLPAARLVQPQDAQRRGDQDPQL